MQMNFDFQSLLKSYKAKSVFFESILFNTMVQNEKGFYLSIVQTVE